MKRKRFSEEQIAFALRQADSGTTIEEICRKMLSLFFVFRGEAVEQLRE